MASNLNSDQAGIEIACQQFAAVSKKPARNGINLLLVSISLITLLSDTQEI